MSEYCLLGMRKKRGGGGVFAQETAGSVLRGIARLIRSSDHNRLLPREKKSEEKDNRFCNASVATGKN